MMKLAVSGAALGGILLFAAAQARGGAESASARPKAAEPTTRWGELAASFGGRPAESRQATEDAADAEVDVVDAHWMALTMWGEARGGGEEAMRAVGHVIANRRRSGRHGAFATDTVSEAWQFSCWNRSDPNLAAIQAVDRLPHGSRGFRMWQAARRIADEILAGRSDDPTGGALFYHAQSVAPAWSRGIEPVARIGGHLFFQTSN